MIGCHILNCFMMHASYHKQILSFGVLTNGRNYRVSDVDGGHSMRRLDFWFPFFQFYEYTVKEDVKQLVQSKTMTLDLTHGVSFQACIDTATPLVSLLVHILKLQKTSFDNALGNQ
jgi:hypothetical protein